MLPQHKLAYNQLKPNFMSVSYIYIYGVTWLLKVMPNVAEIKGAMARQFQSPARQLH